MNSKLIKSLQIEHWLLVGVIIALFLNLGGASLWDIDEGIYGEIAREMLERGDLVVPYYNYAPRYDKPPLTFWLSVLTIKVFGANELGVRIVSALFGVGGIVLAGVVGRKLFDQETGLSSALILGTSLIWFIEARMGLVDTALSFFIAVTAFSAWLLFTEQKPQYYLLLFAAAGLGTLVKGPIALLLPGAIIFCWLGWRESLRQLVRPWFWAGVALFLAIILPWHLAIWQREGMAWINSYFGYHMFTRFTQGIEQHGAPFYYYIIILLVGFVPWSPLFWSITRDALGVVKSKMAGRLSLSRATKFLLWWAGVIIVFFSIAQTKLPGYILPAMIPLAILISDWLHRGGTALARVLREYVLASLLVGLVIVLALLAVRDQVPAEYLLVYRTVFWFPVLLLASAVVIWVLARRASTVKPLITVIVLVALISSAIYSFAIQPMTELAKPVRTLALKAKEVASDEHQIVSLLGDASSTFYLRRQVIYPPDESALLKIIASTHEPLLVMVPHRTAEVIRLQYLVRELATHPLGVLLEYQP